MLNRARARELLAQNNITASLEKHALASEAVMAALASHFGEDAELWSLTGLLHDLDFPATEKNPGEHGLQSAEILAGELPEEAIQAIKAHNGEMNGCQPQSRFDYALRCGESVTGLIQAAALMRPTGYDGMSVKSIKKKLKDKAFAANVSRENIRQCENAGLPLDEFLQLAITAMANLSQNQENI